MWKSAKIGDVCDIRRGASPRPIQNFLSDKGMPWVKIADATADSSRYITETKECIIPEGISKSLEVHPDDLIVSNSATPGLPKIMKIDACIHDGWLLLSNFRDVTRDFLYYKFIDIRSHLVNQANGSVFQNLKTDIVRDFDIQIPSIAEQNKIVEVLHSLDDKIELNNQINRNLEEQVKTLYTKLFVKERNGKDGLLGELISIKYGKDHKKLSDGKYPVYGSGGVMRYVDQFLYNQESVLIPRKGTLNNVMYVNEPFWSVDTMFYTEMKRPNTAKYIFIFLSNQNLESLNAGSAVPSMTTDILNAMKILIPNEDVITEFENFAAPIYRKITDNARENKDLASIRDSLLPRLMSGELSR